MSGSDLALYAVPFLVPGFISYCVMSRLVILRRRDDLSSVLHYLCLTIFNCLIWFVPMWKSVQHEWWNASLVWTMVLYASIVLVSPVAIGLLPGAAVQKRWFEKAVNKVGLACVDPAPAACDWVFANTRPEWAIVTLKSGIRFYGVYRFASSDPAERDIFLDEVYRGSDDGDWETVPSSAGVLMRGDEIVSVEFKRAQSGG